jgi:3-dehydroquinate synthase
MKFRSAGYDVCMEKDSFSYFQSFMQANRFSSVYILCDTSTVKYCLPLFLQKNKFLKNVPVFIIPEGEKNKNLATVTACWDFLLDQGADRRSLLICLGGGVVCDLGGFAASAFKRGIRFVHIPTTLLAMADASVGGKTGVDFHGYKNLIGSITQPEGVFIYDGFLKTLPGRHIHNGWAEIIKTALIGHPRLWKEFLALKTIPSDHLYDFISESVQVKNRIVLKDPNEKHLRQILNFGHTAGHAIETYFLKKKNSLLHGEAVVIGMCIELCLGKILQITEAKTAIEAILFLKENFSLRKFSTSEINALLKLMRHDKKNKSGSLNFALIKKTGKHALNVIAASEEVKEAFHLYNNLLA